MMPGASEGNLWDVQQVDDTLGAILNTKPPPIALALGRRVKKAARSGQV